jgi:hypothetical protein
MKYLEEPETHSQRFYRTNWERAPVWLIRLLPRPADPNIIQQNATRMLHAIGPLAKPAIPALIRMFSGDQNGRKGAYALYALQPFAWEEPSVRRLFEEFGRTFRNKAPYNRLVEAQKVQSLLPSRPVKVEKDIGSETWADVPYGQPSYRLSREQVISILGEPDTSYSNSVTYVISEYTTPKAPQSHVIQFDLAIEFSNDCVYGSAVTMSPRPQQ